MTETISAAPPECPPGALLVPVHGKSGIRAWALVDKEDEWATELRWHMDSSGYVRRLVTIGRKQQRAVFLAREIVGLEFGDRRQADHRNRDTLDNRRQNLRIVDKSGQMQNRRGWGESAARGVCPAGDKFHAYGYLFFEGRSRKVHLGTFADEAEAAATARRFREQFMPCATD